MQDIGWVMPGPDVLIEPGGQRWEFGGDNMIMGEELMDVIEEGLRKAIWWRAANHRNGEGLEGGMDGTVLKKHSRVLQDTGNEEKRG